LPNFAPLKVFEGSNAIGEMNNNIARSIEHQLSN